MITVVFTHFVGSRCKIQFLMIIIPLAIANAGNSHASSGGGHVADSIRTIAGEMENTYSSHQTLRYSYISVRPGSEVSDGTERLTFQMRAEGERAQRAADGARMDLWKEQATDPRGSTASITEHRMTVYDGNVTKTVQYIEDSRGFHRAEHFPSSRAEFHPPQYYDPIHALWHVGDKTLAELIMDDGTQATIASIPGANDEGVYEIHLEWADGNIVAELWVDPATGYLPIRTRVTIVNRDLVLFDQYIDDVHEISPGVWLPSAIQRHVAGHHDNMVAYSTRIEHATTEGISDDLFESLELRGPTAVIDQTAGNLAYLAGPGAEELDALDIEEHVQEADRQSRQMEQEATNSTGGAEGEGEPRGPLLIAVITIVIVSSAAVGIWVWKNHRRKVR